MHVKIKSENTQVRFVGCFVALNDIRPKSLEYFFVSIFKAVKVSENKNLSVQCSCTLSDDSQLII